MDSMKVVPWVVKLASGWAVGWAVRMVPKMVDSKDNSMVVEKVDQKV